MVYVLTRAGSRDDPRLARVHTPDEVVAPTWDEGVWTARCRSGAASNALQSRRYGFALVEEIVEEKDTVVVYRPPPVYDPAAVLAAHGFVIHDREVGSPPPASPEADWRAWQGRRQGR